MRKKNYTKMAKSAKGGGDLAGGFTHTSAVCPFAHSHRMVSHMRRRSDGRATAPKPSLFVRNVSTRLDTDGLYDAFTVWFARSAAVRIRKQFCLKIFLIQSSESVVD